MTICIVKKDHFHLRVFTSLYLDYGLEITNLRMIDTIEPLTYKDGYEPFYNPHCLSSDAYGFKTKDGYDGEFDDATEDDLEDWNDADWQHAILEEADVLIEAYIEEGQW